MIWVITIATFLGTLVAVLLLFVIFSRREALNSERRMESRTPERVGMELYSPGSSPFQYLARRICPPTSHAEHHDDRLPTCASSPGSPSRAAYQDFLAFWTDAGPDIPILKQAKAE
jgi:hypothetical protein